MNATDIPSVLLGSGGTAVVMWMWLKATQNTNKELVKELKASQKRERDLTPKILEAILLNKTFLENHQGEFSAMGDAIKDEMQSLVKTIDTLKDEISS